jgi:protein-tyrosine phosphatase
VAEPKTGEVVTGLSALLVCTANICRSPMAEALWRDAARRLGRSLPVASAGVDAQPGWPADPACVELLAERGLAMGDHRSRRFTREMAADCELVLVMEQEHARRIIAAAPALAGRVHMLGRWGEGPIQDPYGASRNVYEDCMVRLENSVAAWLTRITRRNDATRTA